MTFTSLTPRKGYSPSLFLPSLLMFPLLKAEKNTHKCPIIPGPGNLCSYLGLSEKIKWRWQALSTEDTHFHPPGLCFVLEFILSHADSFKTSHFASYSVNKCQEFTQWAAPADLLTGSPPRRLTDRVWVPDFGTWYDVQDLRGL